ncbi:phosphatidylinositol-specific phospholipase C [Bacillus toyonensis]|nr:phosphatidylinositol-specific phospholipase C [Bacillus toyonensis]
MKKRILILWTGICIAFICIITPIKHIYADTLLGYNHEDYMLEKGNYHWDLRNWMSVVPNNTKLSALSIPGTHDSMAHHGKTLIDKPYTQTQSVVLPKQLESGIRYVDIRIRDTGNSFAIHHGDVYQQAMFGDVLNTVTDFLRKYPTETVIMRVKNEHEQDLNRYQEIFQGYWDSYKSYFWNPTSNNPTLGEIRGKIVVIQNFRSNKQFGIQYDSLNVQDQYDVSNLPAKWDAVKSQIDLANNDVNHIYLNHLSGTHFNLLTGNTPADVAKYINPKTVAYVGGLGVFNGLDPSRWTETNVNNINHTGIITADFPDFEFSAQIINKNAPYNDKNFNGKKYITE